MERGFFDGHTLVPVLGAGKSVELEGCGMKKGKRSV